MATVVVGDIHGNAAALKDLLGQITCELAPEDAVVFLGDYIDRGPDTKSCLDQIIAGLPISLWFSLLFRVALPFASIYRRRILPNAKRRADR